MNKKLAIKGHPTRGKEVIEILKMMGGRGVDTLKGNTDWYMIDECENNLIKICGYNYIHCHNFITFILEEFLEKYPFKVGDKAVYIDDNDIVVISEIKWDDTVGDIFYNVKRIDEDDCFLCPPELLKLYKETNMNESKCTQCVYAVNNNHCGLRGFRSNFNVNYCSAQNVDKLPNGFELQEDGYFSWVNKKSKYPTTYEECCEVLGIGSYFEPEIRNATTEECHEFTKLMKLKRCRNAYWKIAGEEMGLGKPWEPDWASGKPFYCISVSENIIVKGKWYIDNKILAFPTEEMRDAFHENFKELIESCKELL